MKYLFHLDNLSVPLNLTFNGKDKFQTKLGVFLSILSYIAIILITWIIGLDLYKRNPTVSSTIEISPLHEDSLLTNDNFFHAFFISDFDNNPIEDETILNVSTDYFYYYTLANGTTINIFNVMTLVPCLQIYQNKTIMPASTAVLQPLKCIKNLNHTIGGYWTQNYTKGFYSSINLCVNSTANLKKPCKSPAAIASAVNGLYLNIFNQNTQVTPTNYSNPLSSYLQYDTYTLSATYYKSKEYHFSNTIMETDNSIFISSSNDDFKQLLGVSKTVADSSPTDTATIAQFYIFADNQKKTYYRNYIKITTIMANLGGIIQLVFLIFKIIFDPVIRKMLNLLLIENLFDFKNQDRFEKRIIKKKLEEKKIMGSPVSDSNKNLFSNSSVESAANLVVISDKEIDNYSIREKGKKLILNTNKQIFMSFYCFNLCRNKTSIRNNCLYAKALESVKKDTDYVNMVRQSHNLNKIKYLLLNTNQVSALNFLSNPVHTNEGISHENDEYLKSFQQEIDRPTINNMCDYFKDKIIKNELDGTDKKLFEAFDEGMKNRIAV